MRGGTERLLATSPRLRAQLNHRQIALLTHALKHPGEAYRVGGHQRSHGVVCQTARTDLLALAGLGSLEQGRAGRAFVFFAPPDLEQRIAGLAQAPGSGNLLRPALGAGGFSRTAEPLRR